jgi:hypothetical protein
MGLVKSPRMRAKAEINRSLSPVITGRQLDRTHPGANAPGFTLAPALQAEETLGKATYILTTLTDLPSSPAVRTVRKFLSAHSVLVAIVK